jgi:hypothetical protein
LLHLKAEVAMAEQTDDTVPSFDEGRRRPSPIESTTDDGVRKPIPTEKANDSGRRVDRTDEEATATMPPEEAGNPDRNTM